MCGIERTVEVQGRRAAIMRTPALKARTRYGRPEDGSPVVSDVHNGPPSKGGDRVDGNAKGGVRRRVVGGGGGAAAWGPA